MIDSGGLPVTFVRDPDVMSTASVVVATGTNAIGAVELKSAGTEVRLPFGVAAEPRGTASVVMPVQPVDDEGNVVRQSTLELIATLASAGTLYETVLFNAATGPGASPAAFVAGRIYNTVQHVISGTVSVQTRSSLDGVNWHVEAVDRESVVHVLSGPTKYISAAYIAGNGVLTTYLGSAK